MKNRVRKLLMSLSVDPAILGYDYLVEAVSLCYKDKRYMREITKGLYPYIANKYETTCSRVERAMRHAIERACDMCPDISDKLIIPVSIYNGKYKNSQFICACVEWLKMEDENA